MVKRRLLLAALVGILTVAIWPLAGQAEYANPLLDQVASAFALRPVTVKCRTAAEDPYLNYAWGYVFSPTRTAKYTVLDEKVCAGALAVATDDPAVSDWQKSLGVEVLVHESYHLKNVKGAENEAITECRAFRHYDYGFLALGATREELVRIMPLAIGRHYLFIAYVPEYGLPYCKMPPRYWQYIGEK